jgi:hypothetical protein
MSGGTDTYPGSVKRYIRILVSCSLFAERQYTDKPVNSMHASALIRIRKEIRHFSRISFLNHLFAALTITVGMIVIFRQIVPVLLHITTRTTGQFSPIVVMAGVITVFAGIGWLRASIRIAEGIRPIREKAAEWGDAVSDEELTSQIVRLLAYYRENRDAIRTMVIVCTIGGLCFLLLGCLFGFEFLSVTGNGDVFSEDAFFIIPVLLLMPGIAIVSWFSSWYFSKFSRIWDLRIKETEHSETLLLQTLGMDRQ